MPNDRRR